MHLCTYVDYVTRFGQRCRFCVFVTEFLLRVNRIERKFFFFAFKSMVWLSFFFFTEFYRVDVVEFSIFHCAELEILLNGVRLKFLCTTQFVPCFTGYCIILLGFTEFYWLPSHFFTWFYLVFVSFFSMMQLVLLALFGILLCSSSVLLGTVSCYWVLPSFIGRHLIVT